MNGGRKEDFEGLTEFDIALIRVTYDSYRMSEVEYMAKIFSNVISKMFGGGN